MVQKYGLPRCWALTLTTEDNCTEVREFSRRWNCIKTGRLGKLFGEGIRVYETQSRGSWHLHGLVLMPFSDIRIKPEDVARNDYRNVDNRVRDLWRDLRGFLERYGFGRHELLPVYSTAGAVIKYYATYLEGGLRERETGGKRMRLWGTWGGANRCSQKFCFTSGIGYDKRRWIARVIGPSFAHVADDSSYRFGYMVYRMLNREFWPQMAEHVFVLAWLLANGYKEHAWKFYDYACCIDEPSDIDAIDTLVPGVEIARDHFVPDDFGIPF